MITFASINEACGWLYVFAKGNPCGCFVNIGGWTYRCYWNANGLFMM